MRSVELERLTAEGITLIERRNCLELFRDQAAEHFEVHTGSSWRPRSGSMVNHRTLTAAMIDSRDFLAAKRRAETEVHAAARTEDRPHRRARLQRPSPDLGPARQGPRQASRHGAAARRIAEGRRTDRRQMGDQPQGAADRLQAGLDQARQGRAVQAQRRHARRAADRRHASSRAPASRTTSPTRRRSSASPSGSSAARERRHPLHASDTARQSCVRSQLRRGLRRYIRGCAVVVVEGATVTSMRLEASPCSRSDLSSTRSASASLLADLHAGGYALPFFVAISAGMRRFIAAPACSARCLLALLPAA